MPAARSIAISRSTISAVCLRPVRASSRWMNDCTPRLTRLMPASRHASAFSGVMRAGRGFHRGLGPRMARDHARSSARSPRIHQAGRASAQIDGLRRPRPLRAAKFGAQRVQITRLPARAGERPTRSCSTCTSARRTDKKYKRQPWRFYKTHDFSPAAGRSLRRSFPPAFVWCGRARMLRARPPNPA